MNSISLALTSFPGPAQRLGSFLAVAGALAWLAGCGSAESHVVAPPPPGAVTGAATPSAAGTVIVPEAPPPPRSEVEQPRSSSDQVWVAGYWAWRDNRYEWVAGHWEVPPRTDAVWVKPRHERVGDGSYRFYEGSWN
jgi:hypothetical protein